MWPRLAGALVFAESEALRRQLDLLHVAVMADAGAKILQRMKGAPLAKSDIFESVSL